MYFGINQNRDGSVMLDTSTEKPINDQIEEDINKSINSINDIINQYKMVNKNTKLTDQQIIDVTNDMFEDDFILF